MPKAWICLALLAFAASAQPANDPFGVAELFQTRAQGRQYFSTSWGNGSPRTFKDCVDPMDPWFDAGHGSGEYRIDGKGTLTASGDLVRMYVHDPDQKTEWGENLEITAYITRMDESRLVSYSGPQIFARTNHGTFTGNFGGELKTLCDDRGLGAKLNLDGTWAFEKETRHGAGKGYATSGAVKHWAGGFPKGKPVGIKYVLRNVLDAQGRAVAVRLELYADMSGGLGGGTWEKITETLDQGRWGEGCDPCQSGVDPAMIHLRANLLKQSETKRPELAVYFRHEYARMAYERLSIREIEPLPAPRR
jgi:hypothetical protein